MKKYTLDVYHSELRLGQAIYNAVFMSLKTAGKPHTDRDVMNALFNVQDRDLLRWLKEGV